MSILENIPKPQHEASLKVAKLLKSSGGRALLVGGCVRDGLLGIPAKDIDMEVYGLDADAVEAALKPHFRLDTVGRAFGVFILKGLEIDLALPRRESRIGPKHTDFKVEGDPTMSPREAASRRDFTVNAISYDPLTGEQLDPYDGAADLRARRLRHVSEAFSEDPLPKTEPKIGPIQGLHPNAKAIPINKGKNERFCNLSKFNFRSKFRKGIFKIPKKYKPRKIIKIPEKIFISLFKS